MALTVCSASLAPLSAHAELPPFVRAADLSFLQQMETADVIYNSEGQPGDAIQILMSNGMNCVRFRLWHTPTNGWCTLSNTLVMAQRAHDAGAAILLDIHYSDTWADPGQQSKPADWNTLSFNELKVAVRDYTTEIITNFAAIGFLPDGVQIGNEITGGFLWDEGRVGGGYDTNWSRFTDLLKSAITGVTNTLGPTDDIDIMLHIDRGADNEGSRWFFDRIGSHHVPYNLIGLSYYPWWHGAHTALASNIADLASRYGRDIVLVETAYPWTLDWSDSTHNIVGDPSQLEPGFPATPLGQLEFLCAIKNIIVERGGVHGRGFCLWAPDHVSAPGTGSPWENLALFDFQTNLLIGARAFATSDLPCADRISSVRIDGDELTLRVSNISPAATTHVARTAAIAHPVWQRMTNTVPTNWAPFSLGPLSATGPTQFFRLER